jgi:toxin-antitoxin system PIN domain toxin
LSKPPRLLDVNVLVPLLWPPHVHHAAAQGWFAAFHEEGWATCPITQLGCARILATAAVSQGALTVQAAVASIEEILSETHHKFWPADLPISETRFAASLPNLQGPGQLTDRYLLALAAAHGGTLATFDRGAGVGLPADSPLLAHLEIIDA